LIVAIPSVFDPTTNDIDNLPRLVVLVVAAVFLLGIWAVDAVWSGWRPRRLVNGYQWVLVGLVAWFGVTTLASVEPRVSFLGRQGSYEGFLLIASLAVLATALAESYTSESLPALFRVVVASTVPLLVYGGIQVYGYDVHKGSNPDFVAWSQPFHNAFATLGNPNHLGGYLVTVLPLGVVTAVLTRHRWVRVAIWGWIALTLIIILQTAARGAWLGGLAGGAVLVAGLLPRLRASARTVGIAAGGALLVAIALIAGGSRFLGAKASALLQFGSGSSVSQRYGYWSAALHLGVHHPLLGTGPDTYAVTYARYQDASLAKTLGSNFFVNGAHNIFLSFLANEGIPGLLLILALLVFAVAWGARAWQSFRSSTSDPEATDDSTSVPGEWRRYTTAALVAALVAYFIQASFDVEQVGTLFILFVMLGLLGIVNRGRWSVANLVRSPFTVRAVTDDSEEPVAERDSDYPLVVAGAGRYGRSSTQAQLELRRLGRATGVGVVALAALGLTIWRADAMWRADYQAHLGTQTSIIAATNINPWEPSYFDTLGQAATNSYDSSPHASDALALARVAAGFYSHDVALDGASSLAQKAYGGSLTTEAEAEHNNKPLLRQALVALRLARQENPFDPKIPPLIDAAQKALAKT
jgi:O-antigen ligase